MAAFSISASALQNASLTIPAPGPGRFLIVTRASAGIDQPSLANDATFSVADMAVIYASVGLSAGIAIIGGPIIFPENEAAEIGLSTDAPAARASVNVVGYIA